MPLHSRGHRRACDQGAVVKKRDPLVCYRDDDLERALRKGLGPNVLRRFRVCLPVVVLVFVRSTPRTDLACFGLGADIQNFAPELRSNNSSGLRSGTVCWWVAPPHQCVTTMKSVSFPVS